MASARRTPEPKPDATLQYGKVRLRPSRAPSPIAPPEKTVPTKKGVGHDPRRPPPAALPKRARRVEHGFGVGLAIPDALFRASLARGLVQAGFVVHNVLTADEIAEGIKKFKVAILDFDAKDAPGLFSAMQETDAGAPVLALATDHEKVRRALKTLPLCRHEVLPRIAPVADVIEALTRLRELDD